MEPITDIEDPRLKAIFESGLLEHNTWDVIAPFYQQSDLPAIGEWFLLTYFRANITQHSFLAPGGTGNSFVQPVAPTTAARLSRIVSYDPLVINAYDIDDGKAVESPINDGLDLDKPDRLICHKFPEIRPLTEEDVAWYSRGDTSGYYVPVRPRQQPCTDPHTATRTVEVGFSDTVLKRVK